MHYKVSIIIPNRNGAELLQKNLPFVLAAVGGSEIIVVDDASTDASVDFLVKKFPTVKIIKKTHNDGFASSVNMGVREAVGEIVVLLNTDVRPEKDFLTPLLKHFDTPSVFAVGCIENSIEEKITVFRGRGEAKWEKGFFIHSRGKVDTTITAWVSGGSGAFRKSIWEKLGGMDEIFSPFYWEDIDLSYRALKSGYGLVFEPKSVVTHEHAKGAIKQGYSSLQVNIIAYRNQFLFIWKNLSNVHLWLAHLIWTPIRIVQAIIRRDAAMVVGFVWAFVYIPHVLVSRIRYCQICRIDDLSVPLQ
ncbi:MAG: glycosyltransferase family 2 protein [Candidatus Gottesmanbacteria bacterium]|nr:glycosyltransferase family 2 protein [Candidatus Gottesmanbacteria bacterium]